jgi:hypothetical protein
MNSFAKLVSVLAVPIGLLNAFGGIIAGIWLAILGEWGLIGYGIVALFISGFGLGFAMMPGLLLDVPAALLYEKGNKIGFYFFGFLSSLYTTAVLTIWCVVVLYFFAKQADAHSIIPVLLWSYGVATGPIGWLAEKDQNEYSLISTFFAQVAFILVILATLFIRVSLLDITILFGVVMMIGFIIQFRIASQIEKEQELF